MYNCYLFRKGFFARFPFLMFSYLNFWLVWIILTRNRNHSRFLFFVLFCFVFCTLSPAHKPATDMYNGGNCLKLFKKLSFHSIFWAFIIILTDAFLVPMSMGGGNKEPCLQQGLEIFHCLSCLLQKSVSLILCHLTSNSQWQVRSAGSSREQERMVVSLDMSFEMAFRCLFFCFLLSFVPSCFNDGFTAVNRYHDKGHSHKDNI